MPYYSTNNKNQTYSYDAPVNPETPDSWKNSGDVSDTSSVQVISAEYIQPKTWYSGTQPTNGEALAQIARIYEYDQQKATNLYNQYNTLINNPTSSFYQPYLNPTNPAVKNLAQYGIDTSNINDDWFNQYSWLTQYYTYGDTTNTPNKPGKKATIQQKAAYEYYQLWKARDTTNAVNNEWSALQQELQYWAKRDDLNLSDQEIIDKIDWKKYSTLDKLRQRKNPGEIVEINNGTEFSADNMRGVIWAARNNGGERNMNLNTAYSFMGKGNTWQDNPDISEKLKRSSDKYNPNAVGMTLNEAGLYFGRSHFDQEWIDQNRWMLDSQDETQRKMYLSVVDSENTTTSAEDQAAAMNAYIDKLIRDKGGKLKAEELLKYLDTEYNNGEYSTLQKMNKAIENGGNPLGLTRAVDFKYAEIQEMLRQKATEEYNKVHALDIAMEHAAGKATDFILHNDWGKTFNDAVNWLSDQAQAILDNRVRNVQNPEEGAAAPEQGTVAPAAPEATVEEPKTFTLQQDEGKTFDTDIGKEGVRNLRNGWKVQDAVKDGASVQSPLDAAQARIARAKDEKAAAAAAACEPSMNATERNVAAGYSSMSIIASNAISDSVFNIVDKAEQAIVDQSGDDIISGYITNGLAVYPSLKRFERTQDNYRNLTAREAELAAALGDKAYIGNDKKSRQINVQIDGKTYRVTVRDEAPSTLVGNNYYGQDVDNVGYIESIEDISSYSVPYTLHANFYVPDKSMLNEDSLAWIAVEVSDEVQEFIKKRQAAQGMVRTEEEEQMAKELVQVRMDMEDAENYLRQNKEAYEHDMEIANDARRQMNNLTSILLDAGGDLTEVYEGQIMIRALAAFSDYEATEWSEDNPSSRYATRIRDGEDLNAVLQDAAADYAEMKEQLADIDFMWKWYVDRGIVPPDDYKVNVERAIEKINRDMNDYEFFMTQFNSDFQEKAREGEKILGDEWFNAYSKNPQMYGEWQLPGQIESAFGSVYQYLSDTEKDTYYYLYALDKENGTNRAEKYADFMSDRTYGVLNVRAAFDWENTARELTDSGFVGFGLANLVAVLSSPYNTVANLADVVDRAITGRERNPYSPFRTGNIFKNTVREESANVIEKEANDIFGEGTTAAKVASTVAQGMYEILTMRADSAINAMTFGWIFGGGPGAEVAVEGASKLKSFLDQVLPAIPMGISAANDAAAQAKLNHASDTQALLIAAGTFVAETITEGIEIGHITNAFRNAKNIGAGAIKQFLVDWLTDNGVSEMFGETITEIFEKYMDEWVLDNDEHQAIVNSYRLNNPGMSIEEAEYWARRDEMNDYLRTAVISYLSGGSDILQAYGGQREYYRSLARDINDNSITRVTARDIRKGEKAYRKEQKVLEQQRIEAEQEAKRNGATEELPPINLGALEGQNQTEAEPAAQAEPAAPAAEPAAAPADTEADRTQLDTALGIAQQKAAAYHANAANIAKQKALEFLANNKVLTAAQSMERTGSDAAVASVLDIARTSESGDVARATTAGMHTLMEEAGMVDAPAALLQEALEGAQLADVDPSLIRSGMTSAALGGEQSAARQVIMSNEYHRANAEGKAAMLAQAAAADMANEAVQQEISKAVHENRVAEAECALMAEGAGDAVIDLENQVRALAAETKAANQALETQQGVEAAANEAADRATQEMLANPGDVNTARAQEGAVNQQVHEAAVTDERQQAVENAQQREQEGQQKLDKTRNDTMTTVREQAEANVAQEDQRRADAEAQAQEQARIEEEQRAQEQAKADEQSGKAWEDRRDAIIEEILDNEYLEEGERREARRKELEERADLIRAGKIKMAGMMNNTEGLLAVGILGRKLGVDVKITDDVKILPEGAAGKYEKGVVYLNGNMIKAGKMTIGQAVMEVALHEFTHYMEGSKQYGKYSQTVFNFLFQGDNAEARMNAAIDNKIQEYREKFGQELTREGAKAEIVADFAKSRLNDRAVVKRFIDNGLGGRIRNALHNINQAIKNFKLTGQERQTAEYLRKTERLFQKMIEEEARSESHPDGGQFSIAQLAEATGLEFNENTLEMRTPDGKLVDGVTNKITPDMLNNTPVGMMIGLAEKGLANKKGKSVLAPTISKETAQAQRQMFADLANMAAQYRDSNLVWEIASSTLFSAMKSNSDPQYSTTVDFGTICAKTQEIINVMSQTMLEKGRGLTRDEVLTVYNKTSEAGLTVPCPVCYVFSRWMGVPSLLGQMSQYQERFVKTNDDGSINVDETQKAANDYIKTALEKYGDKKGINDAKTSLLNRIKTQENNRTDALKVIMSETATEAEKAAAKEKHNSAIDTMDSLTEELGEIEAFNWVTQALCKQQRNGRTVTNVLDADGNYVIDSDFELTPKDVLFDLRRTGDFAKYTKNWSYRNTRGAGMGKAIMPYSGESIGDIIYGTNRKMATANPFLTQDPQTAAKGIKDAIARAVKQNLIGGQRLQSTSDFRPEWGLDYMMSFLELQAIGSKVQMYTKVAEAVPLLASMGADINLSIMGKGQGWHVNEDGTYTLDFSDVTGMNYETAKGLKDQYSNVQMILVGMNDTHIRLALADSDIDFVIPWHASGNSKDTLSRLVSSASIGQEQLETSSDYTDTQSDKASDTQTAEQKQLWNLRMKILQGKKINAQEREIIYTDEYLAPLYQRFNVEGEDADCYKVKLGQDQAKQIFPYEYWDKTLTKDQADENGKAFVEYCQHFGITPRFSGTVRSAEEGKYFTAEEIGDGKPIAYDAEGRVIRYEQNNFAGAVYDEDGNITGYDPAKMDKGYWKVLIDRPMYDNDGNYRDQQVVDVTKAKIGRIEDGKLVDSDMPLTTSAMYGPGYSEQEKTAVDNALAAINEQEDLRGVRYSDGGVSLTDVESLRDAEQDYQAAMDRNDFEAAQNELDYIRDIAGSDVALDTEYMDAVRRGDVDKQQEMVNQRAAELKAEVFAATDVPAYRVRRGYTPKKTIKVYKTFTLDEEGRPSALFVSSKNALPVGVWLDAQDTYHFASTKNGRMYVPSTKNPNTKGGATGTTINLSDISESDLAELERLGHIKRGKNGKWSAKTLTSLAYRPGWHAGDMPFFPQGGMKIEGSNYENVHRYNQVVFECEMAADQDYTSYDIREDGTVAYHDRQEMPVDGSYKFATNPMANAQDIGAWYISGALKINRALTEQECNDILEQNGRAPQEWQQYQDPEEMSGIKGKTAKYAYEHTLGPLDLDALGYDPNATDGGRKLLDPITYDDDGNIIPLSQRFNAGVNDPRYSNGGVSLTDVEQIVYQGVPEYEKPFPNQIEDFKDKTTRKEKFGRNVMVVGSTPELLKEIGFNDLPMTIKQKYVQYAIGEEEYTRRKDYVDDHKYDEDDFKKLPEKIAHPIAIIWDGNDDAVKIYIDMKAKSGNHVIVPMIINQEKTIGNERRSVNHLKSVHGRQDAMALLNAAIENDSDSDVRLYYLDDEQYKKMISSGENGDGTHASVSNLPSGIIHRITDPNSHVKPNRLEDSSQLSDGGTSLTDLDQQLVDSGIISQEDLDAYNGISAPLEGKNPVMSTSAGPAQRAFGQGMLQESDEMARQAKAYVLAQNGRTVDTNEDQINRAIKWIRSNKQSQNSDGLYESIQAITSDNFDYRSADGQARMIATMGLAVAHNDTMAQVALADAFNRQGTDLGRALQARKIFRLMTPDGRITTLRNMLKKTQDELGAKGTNVDLKFSEWIYQAAAMATEEGDFEKVQIAAAQELAEQIPVSWKDKLTGWRMLSMLGNPRTHVRNIVGNALFMPAVGIKNKMAAVAELRVKKENRTKTIGLATKDAREFAKQDAKAIKDTLTGEAKYKEKNPVRAEQDIWGTGKGLISRTLGKALQATSDFNSWALEAEDWIFLDRHYRNALAGYMTARGLTSKDMKGKTLEDARIYAVQEAQKATYRDANKVIEGLNKFESSHPGVKFFGSAILPFKKTPANILKRGMEYSPAGLIKAFTLDAKHLRQYNDYTKGKLKALPEKAISPTQWIDKVCSGLTGSAITALGFLLASAGHIKCGFDDKDDEFDRLEGEQEYGLTMEIFGQDVSYTLDWAAPLCMPFFVGAAMVGDIDLRVQDEEGETDWYKTALNGVDAILHMGEPIFNLSMLDGVSSLLNVNQNGADTMAQVAMKVGVNYVTSFMPSIVGAAARSIDTTRRMNYKPSGMTDLERIVNSGIEQVQNKFPFLSRKNIPYRNAWGDEDVSDQTWAIIENFLSPGYGNTVERDPLTEEMRRLYDATKESAVVPKLPNKTFSDEKVQYSLDAQQYDQFTIDRNQQAKSILAELIQTPEYAMADDATRAYMVKSVWDYTTDLAKARVSGRNAEAANNPVDMVIDKAIDKNKSDEKSGFNTALKEALVGSNLEDAQTAIAGLRRAGKADKDIKSTVTSTLKPLYQEAYLKDDGDTMYEIEELLTYLDDDMSWKVSDWLKNLDEAEEDEETERETRWLNRNNH